MPYFLALPPQNILEQWFGLLPDDRPELLLASQYLVLGPDLAELIHSPPPAPEPLVELLRFLRELAPAVLAYVRDLAEESPLGRHALLELVVDVLVAAEDGWRHPSQVLDRPRPEYRELLPICLERLRLADDAERPHLTDVTTKVETAARIAEEARLRRRRLHGN